jgi:hypothetical protein
MLIQSKEWWKCIYFTGVKIKTIREPEDQRRLLSTCYEIFALRTERKQQKHDAVPKFMKGKKGCNSEGGFSVPMISFLMFLGKELALTTVPDLYITLDSV